MHAVEDRQHPRHGALHPQREAREAGLAQRRQLAGIDRLGVGLGGDLGAGLQAEALVDPAQDPGQLAGRQQRRRAAAEEDRVDARQRRGEHPRREVDLGEHGADVAAGLLGALLAGHVRVEVAVAAARRAERHVHVEPERPRPDARQRLGRQCAVGRRGISCG